ncbi:hypothetical protein [Paragemmobacter straminiformis]|uniref:Uncharacterized protein n=1 Tax=Paragemmobacter straminiformis TaxID=2045119 RepID=A0A842IB82_9RHOB|nr:hypothetical protein [Gemmobacter straminiformis]MBC2837120.1 hypothetical protein [Gemmobacter straminiformis]
MIVPVFLFFHAVLATSIAYLLSLASQGLDARVALVSLVLALPLALLPARRFADLPRLPLNALEWGIAVLVTAFCFGHFQGILLTGPDSYGTRDVMNFGDLPLHISYLRSFVDGTAFPPPNPGYPTDPLRYPLGADLYNALWEAVGADTALHLMLTGFVTILLCVALLLRFGGWWALGGMFLNISWVTTAAMVAPAGWDGIDFQNGTQFKNLTLALMVPQRSMLFALPIGLMLILALDGHASGKRPLARNAQVMLGLLWGVMPLFHLHAFVAVSLILGLVALARGGLRGAGRLLSGPMALTAYLPAILLVLHSTAWLQKAGVAHITLGWMAGDQPFLPFLWDNFGLWLALPLAVAACLWADRNAPDARATRRMAIGTVALFALFFTVMLAPWDWDNIKLIIWPWLLLLALAERLVQPRLDRLGRAAAPVAAALLLAPAVLLLAYSLRSGGTNGYGLIARDEVIGTEAAVEALPKDAVFAASRRVNHPLDWLGRFRVLGYEGHLWSHGIDTAPRDALLQKLMQGAPDWSEAARALGIDYIYWGPPEVQEYGPDPRPWMATLENVSTMPGFAVYALPD